VVNERFLLFCTIFSDEKTTVLPRQALNTRNLRFEKLSKMHSLSVSQDWIGSLTYHPLGVMGNQMSVTRCTVRDFGNAGIITHIPNTSPALRNDTPAVPGRPQLPPAPMAGCEKTTPFWSHVYTKHDRFTKTGSGRTYEKLRKKCFGQTSAGDRAYAYLQRCARGRGYSSAVPTPFNIGV
jgi:hypothetical protein